MVFAILRWYCLYEHHYTTNNFLRCTFSSIYNKHSLAHLKLFKKFLTTFWTTKTGWEMTCRLIRWPLLEPVIVHWRNNVSVPCSSHGCDRFVSFYNKGLQPFPCREPKTSSARSGGPQPTNFRLTIPFPSWTHGVSEIWEYFNQMNSGFSQFIMKAQNKTPYI